MVIRGHAQRSKTLDSHEARVLRRGGTRDAASPRPRSRAAGKGKCPSRGLFSAMSFAFSCLSLAISPAPKRSPLQGCLRSYVPGRCKVSRRKATCQTNGHPSQVPGPLAVSSVLMSEQPQCTERRPPRSAREAAPERAAATAPTPTAPKEAIEKTEER